MTLAESVITKFRLPLTGRDVRDLVVTNDETTHRDNGLSWYEGGRVGDLDRVYEELWLPHHSRAVVDVLDQHGGVTLVGGVGSGKSAVLYGARAIMRAQGMPYVNINGHYTNTTAETVVGAIDSAANHGMAIVYDSADYLVGTSKKIRSLPLHKHLPRNTAIMERLMAFRDRGGNLVLSSHHGDWVRDMAHPELFPAWDTLVRRTVPFEINVRIDTADERDAFLRKIGAGASLAKYVAQLPDDPSFQNYIVNKSGDKMYLDWAIEALTSYRILKLLVKDNYKEHEPVIDAIAALQEGNGREEETWDTILRFAFSKTHLLTFFTK